jgi:hypothetical protein
LVSPSNDLVSTKTLPLLPSDEPITTISAGKYY